MSSLQAGGNYSGVLPAREIECKDCLFGLGLVVGGKLKLHPSVQVERTLPLGCFR